MQQQRDQMSKNEHLKQPCWSLDAKCWSNNLRAGSVFITQRHRESLRRYWTLVSGLLYRKSMEETLEIPMWKYQSLMWASDYTRQHLVSVTWEGGWEGVREKGGKGEDQGGPRNTTTRNPGKNCPKQSTKGETSMQRMAQLEGHASKWRENGCKYEVSPHMHPSKNGQQTREAPPAIRITMKLALWQNGQWVLLN